MDSFYGHRFPGDSAHRERNHRVAETAAMLMRSGVEIRPYLLPALQTETIRQTVTDRHAFYFARDLKKLRAGEQNKTIFTRTVGALFSTESCYTVYNTRASAMKWSGLGEFKALHSLNELARMNAGVGMDSATSSAHPRRWRSQRSRRRRTRTGRSSASTGYTRTYTLCPWILLGFVC